MGERGRQTMRSAHCAALGLVSAALLTLGGCGDPGPGANASDPRDGLGVEARTGTAPTSRTGSDETGKHVSGRDEAAAPGSGGGRGGDSATAKQPGGTGISWRTVLNVSDRSGDLGLTGGPDYADLTKLSIADSGSRVRLSVTMGGNVPTDLGDDEVAGIGIDIFRSDSTESDYQVFLEGGPDGWRAYLQTPTGFPKFPGSFTISGRGLHVDLNWSALGGARGGRASAFADWSSAGVVPDSSEDFAPDSGRSKFTVK